MLNVLAMDVVPGRKTVRERFAGAINTLALEGMVGDGKALQVATSHELGQNFARAFNTRYLSRDGRQEPAWQTSWGSTPRMIGALVMMHGDDNGLRVPLRLAQIQAVVLAIKGDEAVPAKVCELGDRLEAAGVRVHVDDRTDTPFGRRVVDGDLKGVPAASRSARATWRAAPRCRPVASRAARAVEDLAGLPPRSSKRTRRCCSGSPASAASPVRPRSRPWRRPSRPPRRGAHPVGRARRGGRGRTGRARGDRTVSGRRGRVGAGRGRPAR